MYLLQERELKKKRFGLFYTRLPSLEALDNLNSHCLAVGFPLLTLGHDNRLRLVQTDLGHVLAVGPQGDLVTYHLVFLCRPFAPAFHRWLEGTTCSHHGHNWFFSHSFYPVGGDIPAGRWSIPMSAEKIMILGVNHKTAPVEIQRAISILPMTPALLTES